MTTNQTRKALIVVDVQNDFCEGGSLAVTGGTQVAKNITSYLDWRKNEYALVIASKDWHKDGQDNGGHFPTEDAAPDYTQTWPVHCVEFSLGADFHPAINSTLIDEQVFKGQGTPAYSAFQGVTARGITTTDLLTTAGITDVVVVGIATDFCVAATARDAITAGYNVTLLADLCAGVAPDTTQAALTELANLGVHII